MWSSEFADGGRIYLGMEYCSTKKVLVVEIIEVAGLPSYKSDPPNPYVKWYTSSYLHVYLLYHRISSYLITGQRSTGGQLKRKTRIMYKTTDPIFNEVRNTEQHNIII